MNRIITPLQEFLELTKDIKKMPPTIKMRSIAERLLEKEREGIIEAFHDGDLNGNGTDGMSEQYFNDKYKQP